MRRLFLLLTLLSLSGAARGQELLYPVKYRITKVVLSRFISFDAGYQALHTWKVDLLMVTGGSSALLYHTTGTSTYRTAVGAPAYRLSRLKNYSRDTYTDVVVEAYGGVRYLGQVSPPSDEVPDPSQPSVIWRSSVSGNKSLNLHWMTSKTQYKLTFYCRPL